jgi:hypothetical protein
MSTGAIEATVFWPPEPIVHSRRKQCALAHRSLGVLGLGFNERRLRHFAARLEQTYPITVLYWAAHGVAP